MQFYLFNIRPKLHYRKWRKLRVTLPVNMALFLKFTSSLLMQVQITKTDLAVVVDNRHGSCQHVRTDIRMSVIEWLSHKELEQSSHVVVGEQWRHLTEGKCKCLLMQFFVQLLSGNCYNLPSVVAFIFMQTFDHNFVFFAELRQSWRICLMQHQNWRYFLCPVWKTKSW